MRDKSPENKDFTYFICFTIVLFPDSPAPRIKVKVSQSDIAQNMWKIIQTLSIVSKSNVFKIKF